MKRVPREQREAMSEKNLSQKDYVAERQNRHSLLFVILWSPTEWPDNFMELRFQFGREIVVEIFT